MIVIKDAKKFQILGVGYGHFFLFSKNYFITDFSLLQTSFFGELGKVLGGGHRTPKPPAIRAYDYCYNNYYSYCIASFIAHVTCI